MDFLELIKKQREEGQKVSWSGTLIEYLSLVKSDPTIPKLAANRLYDSVASFGIESMSDSDPRCRKLFLWS